MCVCVHVCVCVWERERLRERERERDGKGEKQQLSSVGSTAHCLHVWQYVNKMLRKSYTQSQCLLIQCWVNFRVLATEHLLVISLTSHLYIWCSTIVLISTHKTAHYCYNKNNRLFCLDLELVGNSVKSGMAHCHLQNIQVHKLLWLYLQKCCSQRYQVCYTYLQKLSLQLQRHHQCAIVHLNPSSFSSFLYTHTQTHTHTSCNILQFLCCTDYDGLVFVMDHTHKKKMVQIFMCSANRTIWRV